MGIKKQKEHKTSYCIMFNLLAKGLLKLIWKFFLQILKWIIEKSVHEMLEHCIFRNFKKDSNT